MGRQAPTFIPGPSRACQKQSVFAHFGLHWRFSRKFPEAALPKVAQVLSGKGPEHSEASRMCWNTAHMQLSALLNLPKTRFPSILWRKARQSKPRLLQNALLPGWQQPEGTQRRRRRQLQLPTTGTRQVLPFLPGRLAFTFFPGGGSHTSPGVGAY